MGETATTTSAPSLHEAARSYLDAGLCTLAARRTEKRPTTGQWKQYQQRLPTTSELSAWFANGPDAVCILCGSVSGHLEMLDFDLDGEAFVPWCKAVEATAPGLTDRLVVEATPSGGMHVVDRCQEAVDGNAKLAQRHIVVGHGEEVVLGCKAHRPRRDPVTGKWAVVVTLIETRGEGGLFLCAPSDGYVLLQGDLCDPPLLTTDERETLLRCARELDESPPQPVVETPPAPIAADSHTCRPGDEFNQRGDVREILRAHGWTLARDGDNEYWRRPGKMNGTSATLKDGVFFVFSTNAHPFEAHQGYAPFSVYAMLEHGGDYSAAASSLSAQGFGDQPPDETHGVDLSGFSVAPQIKPAATTTDLMPAPVSVCDLVDAHPRLRRPVVHGLLREGETMNVIASPKCGKSWMTLDLAIAVATGQPWLGRYATEPGDVLIIDNELHRETSAHRIPKVAEARGVSMRQIGDRIHVDNLRGRLQDIFSLAPYFAAIEPGRYQIIVLDAFYRFMPAGRDENDNGTMANIYNCIDAFANRLGCCFVLIHHSTKGSQSGKSVTDIGAGAGAQSRATDTHLVLRPHDEDGVVVLDAAVRSWPPIQPACLRWSFPVWTVDETLDPEQLQSDSQRKRRTEKKAEWSPENFSKNFVNDIPANRSAILGMAMRAGLSRWNADNLLRIADADGLVERTGTGKRGDPFLYQRPVASTVTSQEVGS